MVSDALLRNTTFDLTGFRFPRAARSRRRGTQEWFFDQPSNTALWLPKFRPEDYMGTFILTANTAADSEGSEIMQLKIKIPFSDI